MANREELVVIRAARAGEASAQLALGKRYLFGGAGLPKSVTTALYWLDRAAHQEQDEAWILIGSHIPFEAASRALQPSTLCVWYERAFDSGVMQAGLVLAKLVLALSNHGTSEDLRRKAWMALEAVAHAGIGEAQWLMAQLIDRSNASGTVVKHDVPLTPDLPSELKLPSSGQAEQAVLEWTQRAADGGVSRAKYALAEHAWAAGNQTDFLQWAMPLARDALARRSSKLSADPLEVSLADENNLLSRCALTLVSMGEFDCSEVERFLELAGAESSAEACQALGLWFGRMDESGGRVTQIRGLANYKKALRWLILAGERGSAQAWYLISRIYNKPEFSQRNLSDAQYYLQQAAEGGHTGAQLELGNAAWRGRRNDPSKDIEAAYWLKKAASSTQPEALDLLGRVADSAAPAQWAEDIIRTLSRDQLHTFPLLVARLELASEFGLTRSEALLLDVNQADRGHCLLIDIRDIHPRSKRRLVLIDTTPQRHTVNRIVRLFDDVDCSFAGPEGNYRQRLYRLRMLSKASDNDDGDD